MKEPGWTRQRQRGLELAVPGGTQATAITMNHGGADGGRSHGGGRAAKSKGMTDDSRAGGGGT